MRRFRYAAVMGVLTAGTWALGAGQARAQYQAGYGVPWNPGTVARPLPGAGYGPGYGNGNGYSPGYGYGNGYGSGTGDGCRSGGAGWPPAGPGYGAYNPNLPFSPAQQQGYREGRLYYETGIAPNHRLSPAEAQGFLAGQRRASQTPWQLDPARQAGWREGQLFWETGVAPNHPLSPAEAQGFVAGERRAASGGWRPW